VLPPLPAERLSLLEWRSVAAHLRRLVPEDTRMDGIRVDRCYYDREGVFVLTGLEDPPSQSRLLDPLLKAVERRADFQLQLARKWHYGTFARVPLAGMLRCLSRAMPADPLFDGVALQRGHHNAAGRLVLSGYAVGRAPRKEMETLLLQLLAAEPAWAPRLAGGPMPVFKRIAADPSRTGKAFWNAVSLFVAEKEEDAAKELSTALLHAPGDVTNWYFRAICYLTPGDDVLGERDLRRVMAMTKEHGTDSYSSVAFSSINLQRLERIQGSSRQKANKMANRLLPTSSGSRLLPEMLKAYCVEPKKQMRSRISAFVPLSRPPCLCLPAFILP